MVLGKGGISLRSECDYAVRVCGLGIILCNCWSGALRSLLFMFLVFTLIIRSN